MPAKSRAQQRLFALAEHNPAKLFAKNKGLAKLGQTTLHEFAATKGPLPLRLKKRPNQNTVPLASMLKVRNSSFK